VTTETLTYKNTDRLIRFLDHEIEREQENVAKFAAELATDPLHAFEWKTRSTIQAAANMTVLKEVRDALQFSLDDAPGDLPSVAQSLISTGLDFVFRLASQGSGETETRTEVVARWARIVDEKTNDGVGEHLRAIAKGVL
jgi:hypothetical protein